MDIHNFPDCNWVTIPEFPDYVILDLGVVIHIPSGRQMTCSLTENGDPTVGMTRDGVQYRRSVKVLVAEAFVPREDDGFDTPIQLDGSKLNLRADNILWRPRWFAWRYTAQFNGPYPEWYYTGPVVDVVRNQVYTNVMSAAMMCGILCQSIVDSVRDHTYVYPTEQLFTFV